MDNKQYLNELYNKININNTFETVAQYKMPNGIESLLYNGTDYAICCSSLRGYMHLMNKIPYLFCGDVIIPNTFNDVLCGKRKYNVKHTNDTISIIEIEPEKSIRYDFNIIDSKKNVVYSESRKMDSLNFRKQNKCFLIEEERLVKRAIEDNLNVKYIIYTNKSALITNNTIESAKKNNIPCFIINDGLMSSITDTRPIPHEIALCIMPKYSIDNISATQSSTILIADNVENPDNLGLIIRTADACGADAVISVSNTTSVYNKNCIRASRGAMGRFPVFEYNVSEFPEMISKLKELGYTIYGSSAKTELTVHNTENIKQRAFVVSNETNGISKHMSKSVDEMIRIPMATGQSSFNVAVAAGIILSLGIKFSE